MPITTPWSVFFPDGSSPANLITLFTALATSVRDALTENLRQSKVATRSRVGSAADRNTLFPLPVVGDSVLRTDTQIVERHNGTSWRNWESDWISYAPVLSASIGAAKWNGSTGTVTAQYKYTSGRINVRARFLFGGAISSFTGALFSLPAEAENFYVINQLTNGMATLSDPGNAIYNGFVRYASTTIAGIIAQTPSGAIGNVANNNPQTWNGGDFFYVDFTYDPV